MNDPQLKSVLNQLADLLNACGESAQAAEIRAMIRKIASANPKSQENLREELRQWTLGMGSLNDLVLRPKPGTGLEKDEVNRRLGRLTEELYHLTTP